MIFITLGSQKFQFNRLLEYVDKLIDDNVISEDVFAQTGYSDYKPKKFEYVDFVSRKTFQEKIKDSTFVITHAGTGAIVSALKKNKRVIAMPRLSEYGEHVDDHQKDISSIFLDKNYILTAEDYEELKADVSKIEELNFNQFISNSSNFLNGLEELIE